MERESAHLPDLNPKSVLRIHFNEIGHPATAAFLSLVDSSKVLNNTIENVLRHLYQPLKEPRVPPVRSVTLVLRSMDGVAYADGLQIDQDHKEIHFSLEHIKHFIDDPPRCRDEIVGVITHEMTHCYQYNSLGTAPGGLIEGIADFVRLRSGLAPPHWKRPTTKSLQGPNGEATRAPRPECSKDVNAKEPETSKVDGGKWDAGYDKTAFFLDWLDQTYGHGIIAHMNETMRTTKYEEKEFWTGLFGKDQTVDVLWKKYQQSVIKDDNTPTRSHSTASSELVIVELNEDEKTEAEQEAKQAK